MAISRFVAELQGISRVADWFTCLRYFVAVLRELPHIIVRRSLRAADARMSGRECTFTVCPGTRVRFDGGCFGLARQIYGRKIYTVTEGFEIVEGNLVVDLGANVGVFSVMAGALGARVIAVEAQSEFISILKQNLIQNHVREWVVEWGLIGGRTGTFSDPKAQENASHWRDEPPRIAFEQLIEKHQLDRIDFLKMDIEGSEFDLLRDNPRWLNRVRKIAMEVHQEFGNCRELAELLRGNGFAVTITDNEQNEAAELQGNYGFIFAKRNGNVDVGWNGG